MRTRIVPHRKRAGGAALVGASLLALMAVAAGAPAMASAPAAGAAPQAPADWPTYHGDNERSGVQNGLSPVRSTLQPVTSLPLDGAVYASPVVVHGRRIVATENDSVYEFEGNTIVWQAHLGTPVPRSSLPCGNINPLGITSTPAYDPSTDTLVVVAEVANPIQHIAFGLDPATGTVRWQRSVDVPGETGIDPKAMQNRAALLVSRPSCTSPTAGWPVTARPTAAASSGST